ncbi:TPA: hypothetical protein QDB44_000885 [Burkholderia vietnamiensis]|nr:hypothetical protein [Burkholderia vietnamiensis]
MRGAFIGSRFRTGDNVRIDARGEFYAYCDGWRGKVAQVGPKDANACHCQIPGGHALVEVANGDAPLHLIVPDNELAFDL